MRATALVGQSNSVGRRFASLLLVLSSLEANGQCRDYLIHGFSVAKDKFRLDPPALKGGMLSLTDEGWGNKE